LVLVVFSGYSQDTTNLLNSTTQNTLEIDTTLLPQPYYYDGIIIGVLFSVEQAQKIDNDYEMYTLMDSIIRQYGLNDSITIGIINEQGKKIATLEVKVDNLEEMINDKESMIGNRDEVINELMDKVELQNRQIKLFKEKENSYEEEKKALEKEVRRQKRQKILGFIATTATTVGIVILSVLLSK